MNPEINLKHNIRITAENGNLEMFKYLEAFIKINHHNIYTYAVMHAAANGHLNIIKYIIALPNYNTAQMINVTVRYSAGMGHLNVVKALIEGTKHTIIIDNDTFRHAMYHDKSGVIEYFGSLHYGNPSYLLKDAIRCGLLDRVQRLMSLPNFHISDAKLSKLRSFAKTAL